MSLPLSHESNGIVFSQYLDEHGRILWLTWSTMNKRERFCEEPDCSAKAYSSLGNRCEPHYHAYIAQGRIAQLPRLAEERNIERLQLEHRCSGDFDYDLGHPVCDFADEPDCPQHKPTASGAIVVGRWSAHVAALTQCRHCHTRNTELRHEPVGDVYFLDCTACSSCHRLDKALLEAIPSPPPRCCADCGHVPKDGHFPYYRGDDPLCAACEENAYGPPEYEDWRERTGRCSNCDLFYDLRCSSDRRDLCYSCVPAADSRTSVSYEEDDDDGSECPGCGCNIRGGLAANGYCVICWQEKFE